MKKIIGLLLLFSLLTVVFFIFFSIEDLFIPTDNKSDDELSITTEVLQDEDKNTYNLYLTVSEKI